ncbi:MAG: hypothetical protein KA371_16210 [Acidobacteria bacterium]|nr:hypothetical protein [Acidobacteriota bacterium]
MDAQRTLSAALATIYVVVVGAAAGLVAAAFIAVPLALLVWLVWDAETAADFTGNLGFTPIRRRSPPGFVRVIAWTFLLLPLAGVALSWLRSAS